jgi:hypothetical protein
MSLSLLFGAVSNMPERKRRNEVLDSNMPDFDDDLAEAGAVELGSGYSVSLDDMREVPTVYVKTYGKVDSVSLRRKIEEHYPGAKIEGLTSKTPVKVCSKRRTKTKAKTSKK